MAVVDPKQIHDDGSLAVPETIVFTKTAQKRYTALPIHGAHFERCSEHCIPKPQHISHATEEKEEL